MANLIQSSFAFTPVISRQEALQRGEKLYFTGKACKNGHICERDVFTYCCIECRRIYVRRSEASRRVWEAANRERRNAYRRAYDKNNPEIIKKIKQRKYQKERTNPGMIARVKTHRLRQKERRAERIQEAAGRPKPDACETCGRETAQLCFDHCHQTGNFRGWLCQRCNAGLGMAGDLPELCRRWAEYLEQAQQQITQ